MDEGIVGSNAAELDEFLLATGDQLLKFIHQWAGDDDKKDAVTIARSVVDAIVSAENDLGSHRLAEFNELGAQIRE